EEGGVIRKEAGGEVVAAIEDDVVVLRQIEGVFRSETDGMEIDCQMGVDLTEAVFRALQLRFSDPGFAMEDLALKVGNIDVIRIDQAETAHAGGGEVEGRRTTQPAGADHQHRGA